ncbi:MAG TPA: hypothetical protein PLM25_02310 [Limnochordia bacterium]|nr:hypothetical protein [Limnochordia bacterium]
MIQGLETGTMVLTNLRKRRRHQEMSEEQRTESSQLVDSVLQICALALTSYPVIAPLLSQLRENVRETLARAANVLPRLSQALSELEVDSDVTEQLLDQLREAVPELEPFFQRLRR